MGLKITEDNGGHLFVHVATKWMASGIDDYVGTVYVHCCIYCRFVIVWSKTMVNDGSL